MNISLQIYQTATTLNRQSLSNREKITSKHPLKPKLKPSKVKIICFLVTSNSDIFISQSAKSILSEWVTSNNFSSFL